MAPAAIAFVVTFLVVCALAYAALNWRGGNEAQAGRSLLPRIPPRTLLTIAAPLAAVGAVTVVAGDFVLRPGMMALVAFIAIIVGVPFSKRVRQSDRFLTGVLLFSLALLTFWPLRNLIGAAVALVISLGLLVSGVETMRRARR